MIKILIPIVAASIMIPISFIHSVSACAEPCAASQAGHGNSNGSPSSSSSGHNSSYSHPHSTATYAPHPGRSSR